MELTINKYFGLVAIFLAVYVIIAIVLKERVEQFAIYESNQRLNNILTNQQALHTYIEDIQKPVIYKLKAEKKLYDEYFEPKILSFTYIARNIHAIENEILKKNNESLKYYKLASTNPRNELNRANAFEKNLIEKFNSKELKNDYKEIVEEAGTKYLLYIKPVNANQPSCMKCHDDPKNAPKELIEQYGDINGFYEKLGNIRAIMSIKIPIQKELDMAVKYYNIVLLIIFMSLFLTYIIIYYLMKKIDKKSDKLEMLVNIDQLTDCFNRRSFQADILREIEMCKNRGLDNFSLITFDIDHFKYFNDKFGHPKGDQILVDIVALIKQTHRSYDRLYRVGGEEFMLISPKTTLEEAVHVCERIQERIKSYQIEGENITLSFGVCQYNAQDDYETLYRKVDAALYRAKENGRDRIELCTNMVEKCC